MGRKKEKAWDRIEHEKKGETEKEKERKGRIGHSYKCLRTTESIM